MVSATNLLLLRLNPMHPHEDKINLDAEAGLC